MSFEKEILLFITAAATIVYLYFGFCVLALDFRSRIHRIFFYMTFLLAFWSFCAFWQQSAHSLYQIKKWVKISFIASSFFYAIVLHFAIKVYNPKKLKSFLIPLIYTPAWYFVFFSYNSYVLYESFTNSNGLWIYKFSNDFVHTYLFILYSTLYLTIANFLLFLKFVKEKSYRRKMQAKRVFFLFLGDSLSFCNRAHNFQYNCGETGLHVWSCSPRCNHHLSNKLYHR